MTRFHLLTPAHHDRPMQQRRLDNIPWSARQHARGIGWAALAVLPVFFLIAVGVFW